MDVIQRVDLYKGANLGFKVAHAGNENIDTLYALWHYANKNKA